MEQQLTFRIIVHSPPLGIDYALQKGKGNGYETMQKQRSGTSDLRFEFVANVKKENLPLPDFSGVFVQGPKGNRFVYLNIGASAGQLNTAWNRRMKIPLGGIDSQLLSQLKNNSKQILETIVPGTDKKGEPTCATVKPFAGWKLAAR